jgi:hypothetical protein
MDVYLFWQSRSGTTFLQLEVDITQRAFGFGVLDCPLCCGAAPLPKSPPKKTLVAFRWKTKCSRRLTELRMN